MADYGTDGTVHAPYPLAPAGEGDTFTFVPVASIHYSDAAHGSTEGTYTRGDWSDGTVLKV